MNNNYIVSLTTIPSKFDNLHITIDSIINQTVLPSKIVVNIPEVYNFRFNDLKISAEQIKKFEDKYSEHNVFINIIKEDFGPGTKLLGLLKSNMISNLDNKPNTYIVVIDDDLKYKPYMIEGFDNFAKTNKNAEVSSYHCYTLYNITIGQGADGFFIKLDCLDHFLNYYNVIQECDYINYHDDVYFSYYFYLINKKIHHLEPLFNCGIYDFQLNSKIDALGSIQGKYSRQNLNIKINDILAEKDNKGEFNFLKQTL